MGIYCEAIVIVCVFIYVAEVSQSLSRVSGVIGSVVFCASMNCLAMLSHVVSTRT